MSDSWLKILAYSSNSTVENRCRVHIIKYTSIKGRMLISEHYESVLRIARKDILSPMSSNRNMDIITELLCRQSFGL